MRVGSGLSKLTTRKKTNAASITTAKNLLPTFQEYVLWTASHSSVVRELVSMQVSNYDFNLVFPSIFFSFSNSFSAPSTSSLSSSSFFFFSSSFLFSSSSFSFFLFLLFFHLFFFFCFLFYCSSPSFFSSSSSFSLLFLFLHLRCSFTLFSFCPASTFPPSLYSVLLSSSNNSVKRNCTYKTSCTTSGWRRRLS